MDIQKYVDKIFNHWSRKLISLITLYIGIILLVLKFVYPTLQDIYPSSWSKILYSLVVILPLIIGLAIYILIVLNKNKITDIKHLLDIFPTYATFIRLLAGLILVLAALFVPHLRALAITYFVVVFLVGFLSLKPLYYDITFRFIRVIVDIILASLVIYYYGNIYSPFIILFFIPITISARYFDAGPARSIAFFTSFILFFVTFIDFNSTRSLVQNYQALISPYITIVLIIFLVGEIIYAERRERIKPIHDSLLKMNKICQQDAHIQNILEELILLLNSEVVIAINRYKKFVSCYCPIGQHGYQIQEGLFDEELYMRLKDWIDEIDITAISNFWDILYSKRMKIVTESKDFVLPLLDNNIIKNISSFIYTKLDEDKGYLIVINNKSANKILIKPFTPDRYDLLTISSTVIDDHSFFKL